MLNNCVIKDRKKLNFLGEPSCMFYTYVFTLLAYDLPHIEDHTVIHHGRADFTPHFVHRSSTFSQYYVLLCTSIVVATPYYYDTILFFNEVTASNYGSLHITTTEQNNKW